MPTQNTEVVVIGGGISGTAAAYELARAGAKVTLLEQGSLASMASGWTLAGVRQSGRHPAELPLATAAVARWERLGEELGADVEYRRGGNLRLARSPEEVSVIQAIVAEQRDLGLDLLYLPDNAAVREIAPCHCGIGPLRPRTVRPMAMPTQLPRSRPSPWPPRDTGRCCARKPQ